MGAREVQQVVTCDEMKLSIGSYTRYPVLGKQNLNQLQMSQAFREETYHHKNIMHSAALVFGCIAYLGTEGYLTQLMYVTSY